jgi:hypothetical protein
LLERHRPDESSPWPIAGRAPRVFPPEITHIRDAVGVYGAVHQRCGAFRCRIASNNRLIPRLAGSRWADVRTVLLRAPCGCPIRHGVDRPTGAWRPRARRPHGTPPTPVGRRIRAGGRFRGTAAPLRAPASGRHDLEPRLTRPAQVSALRSVLTSVVEHHRLHTIAANVCKIAGRAGRSPSKGRGDRPATAGDRPAKDGGVRPGKDGEIARQAGRSPSRGRGDRPERREIAPRGGRSPREAAGSPRKAAESPGRRRGRPDRRREVRCGSSVGSL